MEKTKLKTAIGMFSKGKASTSEAVEIAGLSISEIMNEFSNRGIKPDITKEDIKGSLDRALKVIK